jgi:hypothetical protein
MLRTGQAVRGAQDSVLSTQNEELDRVTAFVTLNSTELVFSRRIAKQMHPLSRAAGATKCASNRNINAAGSPPDQLAHAGLTIAEEGVIVSNTATVPKGDWPC